jgi:hypothetical protein
MVTNIRILLKNPNRIALLVFKMKLTLIDFFSFLRCGKKRGNGPRRDWGFFNKKSQIPDESGLTTFNY